ncbi:hypothetical protein NIES2101_25950 [Calothrix sp. HK-06]|nr:hypothetical protein NIES2101_25950 [Calothrix sp. HK-06]
MGKKQVLPQQLLLCGFLVFAPLSVQAQITPDNTLGAEASKLTPNVQLQGASNDLISGGAQRGSNLFHSFTQFNINDGQRVYFANPSGVVNILTRVTGGQASNILGTLGVDGAANLFLMNPNGILFGKNASLDVRGSFVGTTANAIQFGNQGFFSSANPLAPPLLTINPSALLFNQIQPNAGIKNLSQAPAGVSPTGENVTGLRVPDGKSIALVGGDINIDGGAIRAYSGQVELTSLAAPGIVGLNDAFNLSVPNVQRGNISLTNGVEVNVRGADAGSITINAQNLTFAGESGLRAGVNTGLGTLHSLAGDIVINTTGSTVLSDGSFIANVLQPNSTGMSGNININTASLAMTGNSSLNTTTFGNGNGGNVSIKAADAVFLSNSAIFNQVGTGAVGNGGNLTIDAGSISLKNGSEFNSITLGQGSAGNIRINSPDISIDGKNNALPSRLISSVNPEGVGKAGNIQIDTNSFKLTGGAFINGDILSKGDGGNITINARDTVNLDNDSFISNTVIGQAITKGGDIQINTGSLSLTNGAEIFTHVSGTGNAGDITINARDTVKLDGVINNGTTGIISQLLPEGEGKAGNIKITTGSLLVTNGSHINNGTTGRGDAGNIQIKTGTLTATNGADIRSDTFGGGNAGNITVESTDAILLDGVETLDKGTASNSPSGIFSQLLTGAGKGGDIQITTGSLKVTNGAQIATNTNGNGNAGNITINARDTVTFEGFVNKQILYNSQVSSSVGSAAVGNGGDIRISGNTLLFKDGGLVQAISGGQGNAGNIFLNARNNITFNGVTSSGLPSIANTNASGNGNGGNIQLVTGSLFLTSGGEIVSSMAGKGNAGNITIDARDIVIDGSNVIGANSGLTSNLLTNAEGKGGDIQITTNTLKVTNGGVINSGTSGKGKAGEIRINASDYITITGSGLLGFSSGLLTLTERDAFGDAGNIIVTTGKFRVADGAIAAASTFNDSKGGDITINANTFEAINGGQVITNTSGSGNAGNIRLNIKDNIQIAGNDANFTQQPRVAEAIKNPSIYRQSDVIVNEGAASGIFANTTAGSSGRGGSIFIDPRFFSLRDGGKISVNSAGTGNAGDISILGSFLTLNNGASITAQTASSQGGNIDLQLSDLLVLRRGSQISTNAGTADAGGDGGNININTPFIVAVPDENSNISANAFIGKGGNVNIRAQGIFGIEPSSVPSTFSSITASSERGVQGQISITQPEVQPTQGIIELPTELVDISNQIGQICPRGANVKRPLGEFTVTGRGSLPPSPLEPLPGTTSTTKLATLDGNNTSNTSNKYTISNRVPNQQNTIVEAQGWVRNTDGSVVLVAKVPEATPSARSVLHTCP